MHNIIIDANNMLYRAIGRTDAFVKRTGAHRKVVEGVDLSSIQSFFWDLYKCTEDFQTVESTIYLVWDKKLEVESGNWRNEVNPEYKGNRDQESPLRKSVHHVCPHIKKVADSMGIRTIYPLTSECDDIINFLVKNLEGNSVIVSSDQDFYQCVNEDTCIYNPHKRFTLTETNFTEHVPVDLKDYVKWKSIKGDPSDNIKGLYRYGDKRAKNLIDNWEELSKKLTEEDHDNLKNTMDIIDLNSRPLSVKELYVINYQLNLNKDKYTDRLMTNVLDKYQIGSDVRMMWENYFNLMEMASFYTD
jgi:5'-3' exonuclease